MANRTYADKGRIEFGAGIEPAQQEEPTKAERDEGLRESVLEAIGTSDFLHKVDIRELHSPNHYRVNVYLDFKGKIRMSDSYYVTITPEKIVSSPPMVKKYHDGDLALLSASR